MRLFKTTYRDGDGSRRQSRRWSVEFIDHRDIVRRLGGHADKAAARHLGTMVEALVAHRRRGERPGRAVAEWIETLPRRHRDRLVASGLLDRREGVARLPLAKHLDDFRAALLAREDTAAHADLVAGRARRVFEGCGFRRWSEISASKVQRHLKDLRDGPENIGHQTSNFYLASTKQFCGWMVDDGRAQASPVEHLRALRVREENRRHARRALSDGELTRLIAAAERGPKVLGVAGPDRAMLYRLALGTGFRANELRSLTPGSFNLADLDRATVVVEAAYSKHRRRDVQPIRPDLAERMRLHLAGKERGRPVLRVPSRTAEMMRADLATARQAWVAEARTPEERVEREESSHLAYRDDAGRVADFHSLRHAFISRLARFGVHPAAAKTLARHSTIALTMDHYTHTVHEDARSALERVPAVGAEVEERGAARAAGAGA